MDGPVRSFYKASLSTSIKTSVSLLSFHSAEPSFSACDQDVAEKDLEEKIGTPVEEEFLGVGFVEFDVKGALIIRNGVADQIIESEVFVSVLDAESCNSTMSVVVIYMIGDTKGFRWHGRNLLVGPVLHIMGLSVKLMWLKARPLFATYTPATITRPEDTISVWHALPNSMVLLDMPKFGSVSKAEPLSQPY